MIIYSYKNFAVIDNHKELIIKNLKGEYKNHAHFKRKTNKSGEVNLNAVKTCINLVANKKKPRSKYMMGACKRLAIDKEYIEMLERLENKEKNRYRNRKI